MTAFIIFIKFGHKLVEEEGAIGLAEMAGGAEVEEGSDEDEEKHASARGTNVRLNLCQGVRERFKGVWKRIKSLAKVFQPVIETGSAVASLVGSVDQDLLMPIVKIMMTVFQIVSNMPAAINLQFPPRVTRLFAAFAFVNFTSMNFGSPQCYYKYDYVDLLMLQTVAPLVLIGLLFLAYLVDHRCRAVPMERSVYVTWFFLITYLVLPRYSLMLLLIIITLKYYYFYYYPSFSSSLHRHHFLHFPLRLSHQFLSYLPLLYPLLSQCFYDYFPHIQLF